MLVHIKRHYGPKPSPTNLIVFSARDYCNLPPENVGFYKTSHEDPLISISFYSIIENYTEEPFSLHKYTSNYQ